MFGRWKLNEPLLICALLALAVAAVYLPAVFLDFTNYDDPYYVTENPHVRDGLSSEAMQWAFTHTCAGNWHPLTLISHQLDCDLFGLQAGGHHLMNVLLHAMNTVALFLLLRTLTDAIWRSAAVAALFGLHPLHVESVAWIAERKDVLSTLFGLLSLWAYAAYAKSGTSEGRKRFAYLGASLSLFLAGLMSKPMLVTWPFVMLLLDYWPLRRLETRGDSHLPRGFGGLIAEKLPFFALSGASCVVTFLAQREGTAVAPLQEISIGARALNAIISYARYIAKLIWPTGLAPIYPYVPHWPRGDALIATLLFAVITGLSIWQWKRRPYLVTGWAWYLGTLVPVIGLVQVGNQSIADRYTYIPAIGLFVMVVWSMTEWVGNYPWRAMIARLAAIGSVTALALATQNQLMYWQNTETLFRHAIAVTTNNYVAWSSLGFYFADRHETRQAERCFHTALAINPRSFFAWNKLATILLDEGRYDEAMGACQMALSLNPQMPAAHRTLGLLLMKQGKAQEAIQQYEESLRFEPENASAHYNLANALAGQGEYQKAREHDQESVRLDPSSADAHHNTGYMLVREGKLSDAISEFKAALALEPRSWHAHYGLGDALARQGRLKEAGKEFLEVLKIDPRTASAQAQINRIAWILASAPDPQARDGPVATEFAQRLCESTGYTNAVMIETLAIAQAECRRFAEATTSAERARSTALAAGQAEAVRKAEELLELFRASQPYREASPPRSR